MEIPLVETKKQNKTAHAGNFFLLGTRTCQLYQTQIPVFVYTTSRVVGSRPAAMQLSRRLCLTILLFLESWFQCYAGR